MINKEVRIYLGQSIHRLYTGIPTAVYVVLVLGLLVGLVFTFSTKRKERNKARTIGQLLLAEYVILVYLSAVVFRTINESRGFNFMPFWSYKSFLEGKNAMLVDNFLNVIVFIPIGLLCGVAFKKMNWKRMLLFSVLLSLSIEALQFFLNRGFAEFDDMMHNVIGCMIGYGIYKLVYALCERVSKRRVAVL